LAAPAGPSWPTVYLRPAESGQEFAQAYVVDQWSRDTIGPMVISASSGPKAYLKNEIRARFEADQMIESAMLVVVRGGSPVVLWRVSEGAGGAGGYWVDVTGVMVEVREQRNRPG
jgi:hypothetical protein